MAEDTKTTPATRPAKTRLIRVAAIKELPLPVETPSGVKFALTIVTAAFKQEDVACTKEVYEWAKTARPSYHVHSEWVITTDATTGVITRVMETPKPNSMPGFTKVEDGREASKCVVISLYPDGSSAVTGLPERANEAIATEIQNAVTDVEVPIHTGMQVGRFVVTEKREVFGATEIHVDPMPKQ